MRKQIYKAICERISQQVSEVRKERIISKKTNTADCNVRQYICFERKTGLKPETPSLEG